MSNGKCERSSTCEFGWYCEYLDKLTYDEIKHLTDKPQTKQTANNENNEKIVYCKDCVYFKPYDWIFNDTWMSTNIDFYKQDEMACGYHQSSVRPDDFCSFAIRKDAHDT